MKFVFVASVAGLLFAAPALAQQLAAVDSVRDGDAAKELSAPLITDDGLVLRAALARIDAGKTPIERDDVDALRAFYKERAFEPVWVKDGRPTWRAVALIERMSDARRDGLDPIIYEAEELPPAASREDEAQFDITLSRAAATYARHLASGRIDPSTVSNNITLKPIRPNARKTLERLSRTEDPAAVLSEFEPIHPQYRALKARLSNLLQQPIALAPPIPEGRLLKVGMRSERIVLLRWRLGIDTSAGIDPAVFDDQVHHAVVQFQQSRLLSPDGIVGRGTLAALNRDQRSIDIADITANMERWRWMPRDLGTFHVHVNVPDFEVRVVKNGEAIHRARVVVGKPQNQTPIFSDEMEHIVVNPYWNVPSSILVEEMLPSIRRNPTGYLASRGYQVLASVRGKSRVVDPARIDWYRVDPKRIRIRQAPGARNALGRIKFLFPNEHAVYLHDTPAKSLFKHKVRAYSHGCVRVQDPFAFADAVLSNEGGLTGEQVRGLLGGRERWVNVKRKIPVHLTYFTLEVEENGGLRRTADIYGHDRRLKAMLGL